VKDATDILKLPKKKVMKLLPYFAESGWLKRVKRGLYLLVPLEAKSPGTWTENDWVIAAKIFDPCYVAGWSAAGHFGFTDQLFNTTVVCTTKRVRHHETKIGEFSFVVRTVKKERLFGLIAVWRGRTKIMVSDPSRTIVDILSAPGLGGGIRHVADILVAYFCSEHRNDAKLMEYCETFGSTAVWKRLGYIIEALSIDADALVKRCECERGRGIAYLDPDLPHKGRKNKRWKIIQNATLEIAT
jgi:predicted transcriptional regulator of viral defense system